MTTFVDRAGWNARPWRSFVPLDWTKVDKFIVHFSGAPGPGARAQSVRSIQDYCMDTKGMSDIDYSELVRGDVVYAGRMDHVGGHTFGINSSSYGVCMIGNDGDVTDADKQSIRERYEYACGRAGRRLTMYGHGDAPGRPGGQQTDCPGPKLRDWVRAGMPWPNGQPSGEDDDLFCVFGDQNSKVQYMQMRVVRAGGNLADVGGTDGEYGNGTARELAKLVGGDGKAYGPTEMNALDEIIDGKITGTPGPKGDPGAPGEPGKTPTHVALDLSGVNVVLPVIGVA